MKTITTLLIILITSASVLGQSDKVETIKKNVSVTISTEVNEVARLYRYKDSRISKALSFTTKQNNTITA